MNWEAGVEVREESTMMVKALRVGSQLSSLHVGHTNVRRYFPRSITKIELQLDHLRIECGLAPGFWRREPEIHDPRLCLWLQSKSHTETWCCKSVPFAMTPSGGNCFKLEPVSCGSGRRTRHAAIPFSGTRFEIS
jgi:hypothetical protein